MLFSIAASEASHVYLNSCMLKWLFTPKQKCLRSLERHFKDTEVYVCVSPPGMSASLAQQVCSTACPDLTRDLTHAHISFFTLNYIQYCMFRSDFSILIRCSNALGVSLLYIRMCGVSPKTLWHNK